MIETTPHSAQRSSPLCWGTQAPACPPGNALIRLLPAFPTTEEAPTGNRLTATLMGFAFAFGVLARLIQREAGGKAGRLLDGTAVAAATLLPLLMVSQPEVIGLLQRTMFAVAYIWYGREAFQLRQT